MPLHLIAAVGFCLCVAAAYQKTYEVGADNNATHSVFLVSVLGFAYFLSEAARALTT
jgi:hypothetical protein